MAREVWNDPLTGSPGKRRSTRDPLTEHDVAERLDKAALRTARIMISARQTGLMDLVKRSRYLTNTLNMLAAELAMWGVEPQQDWAQEYPDPAGAGQEEHPGGARDGVPVRSGDVAVVRSQPVRARGDRQHGGTFS